MTFNAQSRNARLGLEAEEVFKQFLRDHNIKFSHPGYIRDRRGRIVADKGDVEIGGGIFDVKTSPLNRSQNFCIQSRPHTHIDAYVGVFAGKVIGYLEADVAQRIGRDMGSYKLVPYSKLKSFEGLV